jgi:hypothetical protein
MNLIMTIALIAATQVSLMQSALAQKCPAPTNLTYSINGSQISFSWQFPASAGSTSAPAYFWLENDNIAYTFGWGLVMSGTVTYPSPSPTASTSFSTSIGTISTGASWAYGQTYDWRVKMQSCTGASMPSDYTYGPRFTIPSEDATPPSTPGSAVLSGYGKTWIGFTWSASSDQVGVAQYIIYRDGMQIGTPTSTSYTDSGLSIGTEYIYTIAAKDAAGNMSSQCTAVTLTTIAGSTGNGCLTIGYQGWCNDAYRHCCDADNQCLQGAVCAIP